MKELRGTGITTQQIRGASLNAVYVWVDGKTEYPSKLALDLGRSDITFIGPSKLENIEWWVGRREIPEIIIDHATRLSDVQLKNLLNIRVMRFNRRHTTQESESKDTNDNSAEITELKEKLSKFINQVNELEQKNIEQEIIIEYLESKLNCTHVQ